MINGKINLEKQVLDLENPVVDFYGEESYNLVVSENENEIGYFGSFKPKNDFFSNLLKINTASIGSIFFKSVDYDNSNKHYCTNSVKLLLDDLRKREVEYLTIFGILNPSNVNKFVKVGINNNINQQYYFRVKEKNIGDCLTWKL